MKRLIWFALVLSLIWLAHPAPAAAQYVQCGATLSAVGASGETATGGNTSTGCAGGTAADTVTITIEECNSGCGAGTGTTPTDSDGNTYSKCGVTTQAATDSANTIFYSHLTTKSGSVNYTYARSNSFNVMKVRIWKGGAASPCDTAVDHNTAASVTSLNGGAANVTPSNCNSMVLTSLTVDAGSAYTVTTGGFSTSETDFLNGTNLGGADAVAQQTSIVAVNPAWSWTGAGNAASSVAVFIAANTSCPGGASLCTLSLLGVGKCDD